MPADMIKAHRYVYCLALFLICLLTYVNSGPRSLHLVIGSSILTADLYVLMRGKKKKREMLRRLSTGWAGYHGTPLNLLKGTK